MAVRRRPADRRADAARRIFFSARFCPDGTIVATASEDRTVRLWDATTAQAIGPALEHPTEVLSVAFDPDGKSLLTGGQDGIVRRWPVPPPVEGDAERIGLWTQVLTGMDLDADGLVHPLDAPAWQRAKRRLEEKGGPPMP